MKKDKFKYIYGPVPSWRLGSSLGVDIIASDKKHCLLDCIYCQLGPGKTRSLKRKIFVPTKKIIDEIKRLPSVHIDYITFSGNGEPTLARNLGTTIKEIKKIRKEPVAVLSGSSLIFKRSVQDELKSADLVELKLDADCQDTFNMMNRPNKAIDFSLIVEGMMLFRKRYRGKLILQVMFTKENEARAEEIAQIAKKIKADEIHITTSTRSAITQALSVGSIASLKCYFRGMRAITIYEVKRKRVIPLSLEDTLKRRPVL